jgi:hypothetical protein
MILANATLSVVGYAFEKRSDSRRNVLIKLRGVDPHEHTG